jgi:hypothetical protein
MNESSTAALLFSLLFLVLAFSSVITLVGSLLVIWYYRRSVVRGMNASGFCAEEAHHPLAATPPSPGTPARGDLPAPVRAGLSGSGAALFRSAVGAPRVAAACSAAAGLAYALVLAFAYVLAFPAARTPMRFALTLWVALWPVVVAVAFTAPRFARWALIGTTVYFIPFGLGTLALLVFPEPPPPSAEAALLAIFNTVTPHRMIFLWVVFAGVPTGVLLLFLNPKFRAVSPLLLAFSIMSVLGFFAFWIGVYTQPIKGFAFSVAEVIGSRWGIWVFLAALAVTGVAAAVLGAWLALSWVKRAYLAKVISDRSLTLDAFWIFFAICYAMQWTVQGAPWLLTGVLAFVAYRITLAAAQSLARRCSPPLAPCGLIFLRVFSLGPKSNALFDTLAKYWRRIGSMQLITGPDIAHSTVQPHQLLDFLTGRLDRHFINDTRSLETRLDLIDRDPDRDGWYRINNFFCRNETWKAVLAQLVRQGDVVLMDLRSFSARNAGSEHELRHLIEFVPLVRCVFIVDRTTDIAYLRSVLDEAWRLIGTASPNCNASPDAVNVEPFDAGPVAMRELLRRLCSVASTERYPQPFCDRRFEARRGEAFVPAEPPKRDAAE